MTDLLNIRKGDYVKISLLTNPVKQSVGEVMLVLDSDSSNTIVVLENGHKGKVIQILDSVDIIKERIRKGETQYVEFKKNFGEAIMRDKVIPQTVQSFLNSEGGYLYIGVRDTGKSLEDKLEGLDVDFALIDSNYKLISNDKMCDKLACKIKDSLQKYLASSIKIGPLIDLNFIHMNNVQILEIKIKKSPEPWFYQHITKSNKQKQFQIAFQDGIIDRRLDDFYIRNVNAKELLHTHKEVYDYICAHFIND